MTRDFAERLKELREAAKLSQNEVAAAAKISPATFSRILSGERPLSMAQALRIARALGVTVLELTAGTTAEGILTEWVPRSEYQSVDHLRAKAQRESEAAQRELQAERAQSNTLREGVRSLTVRLEEALREHMILQAKAAQADKVSKKNAELERLVVELRGEIARLASHLEGVSEQLGLTTSQAYQNYQAWDQARSQVQALEKTLKAEKAEKVGVAFVSAALGGLVAAMAAEPARRGKGRRT